MCFKLYTISCVYHALSRRLNGKKVMRMIDHCNVYLLVLGTYVPVSLLGVGAARGSYLRRRAQMLCKPGA